MFPGAEKYLPIADYLIRIGYVAGPREIVANLLVPDWDMELELAQGIDWPSANGEPFCDEFGEL